MIAMRARLPRWGWLCAVVLSGALGAACLMPAYLVQATGGQLDLLARARPIDRVIQDPEVSLATRELLAELPELKRYAADHGLRVKKIYTSYVEVPPEATVWYVGAAEPLSFRSRRFCFPVAGCFTGLGWFDLDEALAYRDRMARRGYDVYLRPAAAYSTGGFFPDPVTSSMLSSGPDSVIDLANVIFHESVHATVLIPNQMFFNESLAEFIGDTLTVDYLAHKYGADSPLIRQFRADEAWRQTRVERLMDAYRALDALYRGTKSRAEKLREKEAILDALVVDLRLQRRPNNASLIELRMYKGGHDWFAETLGACGSVSGVLAAAKRLGQKDFQATLQEDLAPVAKRMAELCASRGATR